MVFDQKHDSDIEQIIKAYSIRKPFISNSQMPKYLRELEAEAIEIIREAIAQIDKVILLYSMGKDSTVLLHLLRKAFYPSPPPIGLLQIATGWDFFEMLQFRNLIQKYLNININVFSNKKAQLKGINPLDSDINEYSQKMQIDALSQAIKQGQYQAAIGGGRRDEEKSRAKERIFSIRENGNIWNPRLQRPELWDNYNGRINQGQTLRIFPISNWTELDIWQYIEYEKIPIVPLYFAKLRPTITRDNVIIMPDDDRFKFHNDEIIQIKSIRFRTLGCYPLTAAILSTASNVREIIEEIKISNKSERSGRLIDKANNSSMEDKKRIGYF